MSVWLVVFIFSEIYKMFFALQIYYLKEHFENSRNRWKTVSQGPIPDYHFGGFRDNTLKKRGVKARRAEG